MLSQEDQAYLDFASKISFFEFREDLPEFAQSPFDYAQVKSRGWASVNVIASFFSSRFEKVTLDNRQTFDFEALHGIPR